MELPRVAGGAVIALLIAYGIGQIAAPRRLAAAVAVAVDE